MTPLTIILKTIKHFVDKLYFKKSHKMKDRKDMLKEVNFLTILKFIVMDYKSF